jgi:hypothetical protein
MSEKPNPAAVADGAGFSDADKLAAKNQLERAFDFTGLVTDRGIPVCPNCGADKKGKVILKASSTTGIPYWKCHKCSERGDAINLLTRSGWSFPDAMNALLGRGPSGQPTRPTSPRISVAEAFTAVVDVEVYNAIRDAGDLAGAQTYYARWHIDPAVVEVSGSRYMRNCEKVHADLLERFGRDRLFAAGVITVDKNGKDFFLFSDDYPVIEPHLSPNGHVVGMQFRPSPKRVEKVRAHKRWKQRWSGHLDADGNEIDAEPAWQNAYVVDPVSAGERAKYIAPFLSLRGAGTDSLVGCGIAEIMKLPVTEPPTRIYVVEGFKDWLAARTLGVHAYAIPGTGVMPPEKVCKLLKRHLMVVTLDGDDAGAKGRANLMRWFEEQQVPAVEKTDMRAGMDIADILVESHAHRGCACPTCVEWRDDHPFDPATCPCRSCKVARN